MKLLARPGGLPRLPPVRDSDPVLLSSLERHLTAEVPGFSGPMRVERLPGGQSNPTYIIHTPGRRYVLRCKPTGPLLGSAHAVDREYRVLAAVHGQPGVPVAEPLLLCTDDTVFGIWFYLMEHVEGRIFWDAALPEVASADRPRYFEALIDALAALHRLDPVAIGLKDFGRTGAYVERQVRRWSSQYLEDEAAGRVEALDRMVEWLPAHLPTDDQTSLVHGDYRIDNVIFHPTEPRILAVLDWELSTLGHPLADLAYHLLMYRMPTLAVTGLLGKDLKALNIPDETAHVARYCRQVGLDAVPDLEFYVAFNLFRLAAILHGIRGRAVRGTAASAKADRYAAMVEPVAQLAWDCARRISA
ncbi:MAG: phosphotransferase [Steroidobacteraceae bacterium]